MLCAGVLVCTLLPQDCAARSRAALAVGSLVVASLIPQVITLLSASVVVTKSFVIHA